MRPKNYLPQEPMFGNIAKDGTLIHIPPPSPDGWFGRVLPPLMPAGLSQNYKPSDFPRLSDYGLFGRPAPSDFPEELAKYFPGYETNHRYLFRPRKPRDTPASPIQKLPSPKSRASPAVSRKPENAGARRPIGRLGRLGRARDEWIHDVLLFGDVAEAARMIRRPSRDASGRHDRQRSPLLPPLKHEIQRFPRWSDYDWSGYDFPVRRAFSDLPKGLADDFPGHQATDRRSSLRPRNRRDPPAPEGNKRSSARSREPKNASRAQTQPQPLLNKKPAGVTKQGNGSQKGGAKRTSQRARKRKRG